MKRSQPWLVLFLMLLTGCLHAQSFDDMAQAKLVSFDKVFQGTDKMLWLAPEPGKTWVILSGSVQLEAPQPELSFFVFINDTDGPDRSKGMFCPRCVTLIHLPAGGNTFFPIVGGYSENLHGQTMPIVIRYPHRLMIALSPVHGAVPVSFNVYARFQIVERD